MPAENPICTPAVHFSIEGKFGEGQATYGIVFAAACPSPGRIIVPLPLYAKQLLCTLQEERAEE